MILSRVLVRARGPELRRSACPFTLLHHVAVLPRHHGVGSETQRHAHSAPLTASVLLDFAISQRAELLPCLVHGPTLSGLCLHWDGPRGQNSALWGRSLC